jgi:very-short-patch-repair endonuclease
MSWLESLGVSGMPDSQYVFLLLALGGALMAALSKFRSRRLTPKEKPNRSKTRKPINTRGRITVHDNPFKIGCRKPLKLPQAQCIAIYRDEQLRMHSEAVAALLVALKGLGIEYRREEPVIVDYRQFFLVDVWCPGIRVGFECDGAQHRQQKPRDFDRDAIIRRLTGFRIIRKYNGWYSAPRLRERILNELGRL